MTFAIFSFFFFILLAALCKFHTSGIVRFVALFFPVPVLFFRFTQDQMHGFKLL